mmetsp:Transcript_66503/g.156979  ORF Transcript_66503/g.156979 Transcript_66503/m.156979 type:complete len:684 (-) Transcript_66503:1861-3912(-)
MLAGDGNRCRDAVCINVGDVVAIGRVAQAHAVVPAHARHQAQRQGCLQALGAHATDVAQHGGVALDARALRDAQQAIPEVDEVGGDSRFIELAVGTPAGLEIVRGFGAQRALDRVETGLARRERRGAGGGALEGAHIARDAGEQLIAAAELVVQADLGQEAFVGRDAADRATANLAIGIDGGTQRPEASTQGQVLGQCDGVGHRELVGLGLEGVLPLREERVAREAVDVRDRIGADVVEAARLVEVVALVPVRGTQQVGADLIVQHGVQSVALDAVLGRAQRDRRALGRIALGIGCAVQRRGVRREPEAAAVVLVVVDGGLEVEAFGQLGVERGAGQRVLAQAGAGVVGVVQAGLASGPDLLGRLEGGVEVGEIVVPVVAQAVDHLQGHVLVIDLAAVGRVDEGRQAVAAEFLHVLQVELVLALLACTLPLVRFLVGVAGVDGAEVGGAAVQAHEAAAVVVAAEGLRDLQAEGLGRVGGVELQRAAEVAGRGRVQRAGALRQVGAGHVLAADGAADVEAVQVAIAHVAQGHAVEREAELVLREGAHREAGGPLVVAQRVGRLEVHAGQARHGGQRALAGCGSGLEIGLGQALHRADLAATLGHGDALEFGGGIAALGLGRQREGQAEQGGQGGQGVEGRSHGFEAAYAVEAWGRQPPGRPEVGGITVCNVTKIHDSSATKPLL